MPSLKEVRNRISSVASTQQITKAMKMVSAAKLRRAQDAITQLRPYATKLKEMLENLSGSIDNAEGGAYSKVRPLQKVLLVVITSNRGLCGAFNSNVIRTTLRLATTQYAELYREGNVKFFCIGKKASDYFSKMNDRYVGNANDLTAAPGFDKVSAVAENIMQEFVNGQYDTVEIIYNQFKNAAVQKVQTELFLPLEPPQKSNKATGTQYIFDPSQAEILLELIPKALKSQLYKALLDSIASEHGARMTAMSKATDNAQELLKQLKLSYNKARQAAITGEILEIVGGANALKSE
jgi:F-type H+-transporting ATPase subunit gamma